jgi:hypothetical protein
MSVTKWRMDKIILSHDRVTIDGFWIDNRICWTHTTRDCISHITNPHRPVFSVTLLPTLDVPLLPGSQSLQAGGHVTPASYPYCRLAGPRHGTNREHHLPQSLHCWVTSLLSRSRPFLSTDDVFDYAGACLLSRYVATAVSSIFHVTILWENQWFIKTIYHC